MMRVPGRSVRSCGVRRRLKPEQSMSTTASGRSVRASSRIWSRNLRNLKYCFSTSVSPSTACAERSSSCSCPAAAMRGPPTPMTRSFGFFSFSAWISSAPWASPLASPATMSRTSDRSVRDLTGTAAGVTGDAMVDGVSTEASGMLGVLLGDLFGDGHGDLGRAGRLRTPDARALAVAGALGKGGQFELERLVLLNLDLFLGDLRIDLSVNFAALVEVIK